MSIKFCNAHRLPGIHRCKKFDADTTDSDSFRAIREQSLHRKERKESEEKMNMSERSNKNHHQLYIWLLMLALKTKHYTARI